MEQGLEGRTGWRSSVRERIFIEGKNKGGEKDLSASLRISGKGFPGGECLGQP